MDHQRLIAIIDPLVEVEVDMEEALVIELPLVTITKAMEELEEVVVISTLLILLLIIQKAAY